MAAAVNTGTSIAARPIPALSLPQIGLNAPRHAASPLSRAASALSAQRAATACSAVARERRSIGMDVPPRTWHVRAA